MQHGNYTVLVHEGEELQVISVGQEPWFVLSDISRILGLVDADRFNDYAKGKLDPHSFKKAKLIGANNSEKFEYTINLEGALTLFKFGAKNAKDKAKRDQCSVFIEICKSIVPAFLANPPKEMTKV